MTSWCRRHTIGGDGAVAAVRRGLRQGEPGTLSREQELELIDVLRGVHPDEFGLDEELWTRQSLTALIERRFGLTMDAGTVGANLRAWGLGPREPRERACGLCVSAVERWVRSEYPAITRAAQEHAALGLDDTEPDTVLVLADWQYAGHGHTPGESALAATIARDLQLNRETAREELAALEGA